MLKKFLFALFLFVLSMYADVVTRGVPIPASAPRASLAAVLANPQRFAAQDIVTEGVVDKVCWIAGCWMTVAPAAGKPGMRVTFAKGAFTVPRGSGGRRARLFGRVKMSGDHASFVASGVELTQ